MRAAPPARAAVFSRCSCPLAPAPRLPLPGHRGLPTTVRLSAPASRFARSVSLHVEAPAATLAAPPCRRGSFLRHGESASAGSGSRRGRGRLKSKSGRTDAISASVELQNMNWEPELILCRQQVKTTRWKPIYALETGGSPSPDGQDFEDNGFLGRTRLGRIIQAAARELLQKLNSARTNSPTKIFLVLLGFYTANALATILGQTGDWDVLVAGIVVAAIEGIGMLMYKKPVARPPGRFQSLIAMINYWKAGVCLGLFVDAFKLGS